MKRIFYNFVFMLFVLIIMFFVKSSASVPKFDNFKCNGIKLTNSSIILWLSQKQGISQNTLNRIELKEISVFYNKKENCKKEFSRKIPKNKIAYLRVDNCSFPKNRKLSLDIYLKYIYLNPRSEFTRTDHSILIKKIK